MESWRRGASPRPKGFTFLGLTYFCKTSRKGKYLVGRVTSAKSLQKFKKAISETCRKHQHHVLFLHERLSRMLVGHYAYFGVSGNGGKLGVAYNHVILSMKKWLSRRGGNQYFSWKVYKAILAKYPLPSPKLVRSPLCRS